MGGCLVILLMTYAIGATIFRGDYGGWIACAIVGVILYVYSQHQEAELKRKQREMDDQ